jgi:DNA-binding transcriptional LysR family regulator
MIGGAYHAQMELRQLAYLIAALEEGSFTLAAAAQHVSQPTLSVGLRSLESELGVALFERVGRRVRPTQAALEVGELARRVLSDTVALRSHAEAMGAWLSGRLDLLVSLPTLSNEAILVPIGELRRARPDIRVRIREVDEPDTVAELVRSRRVELGITEALEAPRELAVAPLAEQRLMLVRPPGSPGMRRPMTPAQLAREPLIMGCPGNRARTVVEHYLSRFGLAPKTVVEMDQRAGRGALVFMGAGSTVLSATGALRAREQGAVICDLAPPIEITVVVLHRREPLSEQARSFIAFLPNVLPKAAQLWIRVRTWICNLTYA